MSQAKSFEKKFNFFPITSNRQTKVESDVSLKITRFPGRQRHVLAKLNIPYSREQVWQTLSACEAFAEFIPSLTQSKRHNLPEGGVLLEEVRTNSFLGINFSARTVFEIEEKFPHSIFYRLTEGDMKEFFGYWRLQPGTSSPVKDEIELIFDFFVLPKCIFPLALVEYMLQQNVPANMLALRQRVEDLALLQKS